MLTFLTFFFTLTTGLHTVDLAAGPEVVRVELLVNGISEGVDEEAPWSFRVDFGGGLRTHELTAVGYGEDGQEVARVGLPVNRPGPRARARIVLSGDGRGRVVWGTVERLTPEDVGLTVDGKEVEVAEDGTFSLPSLDPTRPHYLVAQVRFPGELRAEATVALGGEFGDGVAIGLTAFLVEAKDARRPPAAEAMAGWFLDDGEPV